MKRYVLMFVLLGSAAISYAQGVYFICDAIKGFSPSFKDAVDVSAVGNSAVCTGCYVGLGGTDDRKVTGGKVIFSLQAMDPSINTFKKFLLNGTVQAKLGTFVFAKTPPVAGVLTGYYYIQLKNLNVIEIAESSDAGSTNIQISLGYTSIVWGTKVPNSDGTYGTTIDKTGYDFTTNFAFNTLTLPTNVK